MSEIHHPFHPVGTLGFVADIAGVRAVRVSEVVALVTPEGNFPIHVVAPLAPPDLRFREYSHRGIHPTREAAEGDMAGWDEVMSCLAESQD